MAIVILPELLANSASCFNLITGSFVQKPLRKPACEGFTILFFSRNQDNRDTIIFSIILIVVFVRDIGLYEFTSFGSLNGLCMGITIADFHSIGITLFFHEQFISERR